MPFDSTEFLRQAPAPHSRPRLWDRLVAIVGRMIRGRYPSAREPIDEAVLRVLVEARGLIEQREDWTRGTLETLRGERCAVGALRIATDLLNDDDAGRIARDLLTQIAIERGFASIEAMNDHSRHEAVLAAFDRAIQICAAWLPPIR
jgi:hypothetical protein